MKISHQKNQKKKKGKKKQSPSSASISIYLKCQAHRFQYVPVTPAATLHSVYAVKCLYSVLLEIVCDSMFLCVGEPIKMRYRGS